MENLQAIFESEEVQDAVASYDPQYREVTEAICDELGRRLFDIVAENIDDFVNDDSIQEVADGIYTMSTFAYQNLFAEMANMIGSEVSLAEDAKEAAKHEFI